jgi:hypothetical protein
VLLGTAPVVRLVGALAHSGAPGEVGAGGTPVRCWCGRCKITPLSSRRPRERGRTHDSAVIRWRCDGLRCRRGIRNAGGARRPRVRTASDRATVHAAAGPPRGGGAPRQDGHPRTGPPPAQPPTVRQRSEPARERHAVAAGTDATVVPLPEGHDRVDNLAAGLDGPVGSATSGAGNRLRRAGSIPVLPGRRAIPGLRSRSCTSCG